MIAVTARAVRASPVYTISTDMFKFRKIIEGAALVSDDREHRLAASMGLPEVVLQVTPEVGWDCQSLETLRVEDALRVQHWLCFS